MSPCCKRKHVITALTALLVLSFTSILMYHLFPSLRMQCLLVADSVDATDTVVSFFSDDDREVIAMAGDKLLERGARSIPPLIRGLDHPDNRIRTMSAFTLGRLKPPAREAITVLTSHMKSDPNAVVRMRCAKALAQIRQDDPDVIHDLTAMLEDRDIEGRIRAIDALQQLNTAPAIRVIEQALKDENSSVRAAAESALGLDD